MLPHDYLTHRLTGLYTTDRGDASGTGYWSPSTGDYRYDVLEIVDPQRDWTSCCSHGARPNGSCRENGTARWSLRAPVTTWPQH